MLVVNQITLLAVVMMQFFSERILRFLGLPVQRSKKCSGLEDTDLGERPSLHYNADWEIRQAALENRLKCLKK